MLTLFTTLKPFTDPFIAMIQRNAIQSWLSLRPQCQIILLGKDRGVKEAAEEYNVLHIPEIRHNAQGLPFISSLFSEAQKNASFPYLCYLNGDIILMDNFLHAVKRVAAQQKRFLAVGRRWDLTIKNSLSFVRGWQGTLRRSVHKRGILHGNSGIDFFVFPKRTFSRIPDLVVGRGGWDNWMIYYARRNGIPVIDITEATTIIHQEHDTPGTRKKAKRFNDEDAKRNISLAGGYENLLTIRDADFILKKHGVERNVFPSLSLFYPWRLLLGWKRAIQAFFQ